MHLLNKYANESVIFGHHQMYCHSIFFFFDDIWISILSCLFFQATWHACTKQEIRLLVSSSVMVQLQETWCLFNSVCLLTGKVCMCNLVSHYIHLPPHTWRWVKTLVAGYMMSWTNTFHFFKSEVCRSLFLEQRLHCSKPRASNSEPEFVMCRLTRSYGIPSINFSLGCDWTINSRESIVFSVHRSV